LKEVPSVSIERRERKLAESLFPRDNRVVWCDRHAAIVNVVWKSKGRQIHKIPTGWAADGAGQGGDTFCDRHLPPLLMI
jgi:hypothetical protein